jgi:chromosome segregation ATPase
LSLPPSSPASASSLAHTPLAKQNYLVSRTPLRAIELRAQLELFESTKERMYELQTANKVLLDELSRTRDDAASTLAEVKSMWTAETSVLRQELDAMQKERDEAHDERLTVKEGLRRLEAELSTTKDAYKRADLEARTLREDAKVVEALTIAQNKRIHKRRELEKRLRKELEVEDPLWSHDADDAEVIDVLQMRWRRAEMRANADRSLLREALANVDVAMKKVTDYEEIQAQKAEWEGRAVEAEAKLTIARYVIMKSAQSMKKCKKKSIYIYIQK